MKILAVETSGKTFSVAINEDGKTLVSFIYDCGHVHSEMIIPVIEKALSDTGNAYNSIDKFAVCAGPGSFTGIRVGMTVVKTLSQTLKKPVVSIDALSILEKSFIDIYGIKLVAAIDALRDEVYVKSKKGIVIKSVDLFIKENKKYKNKIIIIGNAAEVYKEKLAKNLGNICLPSVFNIPKASVLAFMAQREKGVSYSKAEPLYVRRSWAEESVKIKRS
ncbi:tRNA (adenosine(37)-N6)-threonylcarbamoyltransferase complex dimerization subunit type 1 TsaB [Endomicrobium proavitum]|nr:tRNA (adenosine(37)-N6)-threonylcarbamoyltransferase complex dimerization subunit type 1 TsaB [Endomicrobium proavitum]